MRPVKLVMTAFGPYAGEQIIDFSVLGDKNIFLITGPTGAGKTTIFDGISYAVYGDASGEERDAESLRSQFADAAVMTSVELEFEVKGRRYYIKRIPKQEKPKARGEGTTEQKADAEMRIYDGDDVKTISGISNVNEKVNEIMGINSQQFKQIMMIPQGEFRKLLTSDSKEREKILQKIFGTMGYKLVEIQLTEAARKIRVEVEKLRNVLSENARMLDIDGDERLASAAEAEEMNLEELLEALSLNIAEGDKRYAEAAETIKVKQVEIEKQQIEIFKAKENNKKLEQVKEFTERKNLLLSRKEEFKAKEERVLLARKALMISSVEENYIEREKKVALTEAESIRSQKHLADLVQELDIAEKLHKEETEREAERKQLNEEIVRLKATAEKAGSLTMHKSQLKQNEEKLQEVESRRKANRDKLEGLKKNMERITAEIEAARLAENSFIKASVEEERLKNFFEKYSRLDEENKKLLKLRKEYASVKQKTDASFKDFEEAKLLLEKLEDKFYKAQAAILAKVLKEGEACPVCGSLEHPHKAKLSEEMPDEEAVKSAKKKKEELENVHNRERLKLTEVSSEGAAQKKAVDVLREEIAAICKDEEVLGVDKDEMSEFVKRKVSSINEELTRLKVELEKLSVERLREKSLVEKLTAYKEEEKLLMLKLEEFEEKQRDFIKLVEENKASVNGILKELPEDISSEEELRRLVLNIENKHAAMLEALKNAERKLNDVKIKLAGEKAKLEQLEKTLQEERSMFEKIAEKFVDEIEKSGFSSKEAYKEAKLSETDMKAIELELKEYGEKLKSISDSLERAVEETKEIVYTEISILEERYRVLNEERELMQQTLNNKFKGLAKNKQLSERIIEISGKLRKNEMEYAIVGDLAEAAKGNNRQRLTFERYVLAAFFDEIIEAANLRLGRMTSNRYYLGRIDERAKGNSQSGLELEVFDNYTGRKRHVKTLSGGEGFKASLSLALGLADVVQSYSGGISIDTMFIDEGFGTLDAESLDNAINCLLDLQKSGRLVGIISHVAELKERIDARLEVEMSMRGSMAEFKVN